MAETPWTPGPWKLSRYFAEKRYALISLTHVGHVADVVTSMPANARLISAAPEMAEMLEKMVRHATTPGGYLAKDHPDVIAARAALANARGQS